MRLLSVAYQGVLIHEAAIVILNMTSADIIVVVAHHTDDWTLINGLRLTHHRVDLWTKMIGHIRLLEDCLVCISQH